MQSSVGNACKNVLSEKKCFKKKTLKKRKKSDVIMSGVKVKENIAESRWRRKKRL